MEATSSEKRLLKQEIDLISTKEVRLAANAIYDEVLKFREHYRTLENRPMSERLAAAEKAVRTIDSIRLAFLDAIHAEFALDTQTANGLDGGHHREAADTGIVCLPINVVVALAGHKA